MTINGIKLWSLFGTVSRLDGHLEERKPMSDDPAPDAARPAAGRAGLRRAGCRSSRGASAHAGAAIPATRGHRALCTVPEVPNRPGIPRCPSESLLLPKALKKRCF